MSCLGSEGGAVRLGRAGLGIHPHFRQVIFARVGVRLEGLGGERGLSEGDFIPASTEDKVTEGRQGKNGRQYSVIWGWPDGAGGSQ